MIPNPASRSAAPVSPAIVARNVCVCTPSGGQEGASFTSLVFVLEATRNGPTSPRAIHIKALGRTKRRRRQSRQGPKSGLSVAAAAVPTARDTYDMVGWPGALAGALMDDADDLGVLSIP